MVQGDETEEEFYETEEKPSEDYNFEASENQANENSYSVMKNFFDTEKFLYRKEMEWKGFTLKNNKFVKTNRPIDNDSFINELVGALRSVINQHSSVSYLNQKECDRIAYETFAAFCESVAESPTFQSNRFSLIKEEYDHAIELFLGLVSKGHGQRTAIALQTGVVAESAVMDNTKKGMLGGLRDLINQKK